MTLVLLDYEFGNVQVIKNIPDDIENMERFVYETLEYKDSEISWILLEDNFRTLHYKYDSTMGIKVYKYEDENG